MTPEEARAELGVDRSADGDVVRRAYLRALKLHKPESDPEGFQRVRRAYDVLRSAMAFSAVDLSAVAQAQAAAAPVVVADEPEEADARAPEEGDAAEPAAPRGDAAADAAETEEPWRTVARSYRQAVHDASLAVPPAFVAIDLALDLLARSRPKAARKLLRAFKAYADSIGTAKALAGGALIGWSIANETAALEDKRVRSVIARAALRGDLGLANGALEELRNHYPDAAQQTEATLRRQDGVLWRVYEHVFAPPPPAPVRPATATNRWLAIAAAFVILRLVAGLASWHDRPETNRAPGAKAKPSTELLVFALPRIQLLAKESAPRLRAPAERALSAARKGDCTSVRSALSEMEQISATTPDLFSSLVLRKQLGDEIERARLELGNLCE